MTAPLSSHVARVNTLLNRHLMWIAVAAIGCGILFDRRAALLSDWVSPALSLMIFFMGTSCSLREFRDVFRSPRKLVAGCSIVYLVLPLFALLVARTFYDGSNQFPVGHILVAAAPVAISSTVWTGLARGDVSLALSLVTLVTLLSGFTVPATVALLAGEIIDFDSLGLMIDLIRMIVIPALLGIALKHRLGEGLEVMRDHFHLASKLMILLILIANGAVARPYLGEMGSALGLILVAVIVQLAGNFFFSYLAAGFFMGFRNDSVPTLTYMSMKNNGAGLVIALTYFGPIVALPVVLNIVFQQFLAGVAFRIFHRTHLEHST